MRKVNRSIEQIVARMCKGYAFMSYPNGPDKTAEAFYSRIWNEVYTDKANLSVEEFNKKYGRYIY